MEDLRNRVFAPLRGRDFTAVLSSAKAGYVSGIEQLLLKAGELGIPLECRKKEGARVTPGECIGIVRAAPAQIALAEESFIGILAKYSGIATAARAAADLAGPSLRIVCGSWKKMPPELKDHVRAAIRAGGAFFRITDAPMLYLDKNFIRMFGSIALTLAAVKDFTGRVKVIQIRGEYGTIEEETKTAVRGGAGILMVDSGCPEDLEACIAAAEALGVRDKVQIAYAGGITFTDIPKYRDMNVDMLCIGREIIDAPFLDIKFDVGPV